MRDKRIYKLLQSYSIYHIANTFWDWFKVDGGIQKRDVGQTFGGFFMVRISIYVEGF
jgi:hypothetical protein